MIHVSTVIKRDGWELIFTWLPRFIDEAETLPNGDSLEKTTVIWFDWVERKENNNMDAGYEYRLPITPLQKLERSIDESNKLSR